MESQTIYCPRGGPQELERQRGRQGRHPPRQLGTRTTACMRSHLTPAAMELPASDDGDTSSGNGQLCAGSGAGAADIPSPTGPDPLHRMVTKSGKGLQTMSS